MEIDMRDFLRDRDRKIRAEVAEGIAQAIEARKATTRQFWAVAAFNDAAAIARGYTAPASQSGGDA